MQGVYAQRTTYPNLEEQTKEDEYEYIEAVDCISQFPNLPENIKETLVGYMCPKAESYELKGNMG